MLVGGWFYPYLGFFILLCMVGAVGLAALRGRAWCHVCPMGTMGKWLSMYSKESLYMSDACRDCKLCAKVCPMQLKPYEGQAGAITDNDYIKCDTCTAACPINAL